MDIKVFNKTLEFLGIIENFTSLTWKDKFTACGELSLQAPLTSSNIELLQNKNLIYITGDNVGVIETGIKDIADNKKETMQFGGRFAAKYLSDRINWGRINEDNIVCELLMRKCVNESLINASNMDRNLPFLTLGELNGFSESVAYQNSFGNILTMIEDLSKICSIGFYISFNPSTRHMTFETRMGTNRTIDQSVNPRVLFSRDIDNVITQTYTESILDYKNVALIGGAGEDEVRKLTSLGTATGVDRFEMFVDARDISDKIETIAIPWNKYEPMLKQRGREKIEESAQVQTFDGEFSTTGANRLDIDFFLGDYVTVFDKKWNVTLNTQITEVTTIYEPLNTKTTLTFGYSVPTIFDKIRKG